MTDWLLDTFIWTAALIAVVLLVRRPVARWFGPQAAYALWALPMLRLVLPPLTLPAWMAPETPAPVASEAESTTFVLAEMPAAVPVEPASVIPFTLAEIGLALWLAGAATFLILRFRAYRRMRQDLLAEARDVGRAGKVRLVETPLTRAPLAFGVIDKVVALPEGFLATWDREARDLALAHELAHHQGHDLLINMASQPLFALHWFNPLGHLGWLALRRDQEAACDARVIAARNPRERAAYAKVIANFATGPNVALAAPMACPVLGEKSIIQRLRSIKMNNHSTRQRVVGRGLLAAALIAMPLTATISYAETAPDAPTPPSAPIAPNAPAAPLAPVPPVPPAPPAAAIMAQASDEAADTKVEKHVVVERIVTEDIEKDADGNDVKKVRKMRVVRDGEELSEEQMKEIMVQVRAGLDQADVALAQAHEAHEIAIKHMNGDDKNVTVVEIKCEDGSKGKEMRFGDGEESTRICKSEIMASALEGLREARKELMSEEDLPADLRDQIIAALDAKIKAWESRKDD